MVGPVVSAQRVIAAVLSRAPKLPAQRDTFLELLHDLGGREIMPLAR